MGRDQVTHSSASLTLTPEGQQASSLTGTQEPEGIPTCDILPGHIQDLDSSPPSLSAFEGMKANPSS